MHSVEADVTQGLLGRTGRVLLGACIPWALVAVLVLLVAGDDDGCRGGRTLYAIGQAAIALVGILVTVPAGIAAARKAGGDDATTRRRWFWLNLATGCFAAWLLVVVYLEPDVPACQAGVQGFS
jgi:hypothetical protein